MQGATLTVGAAALLRTAFKPTPALAQQGDMPPGTVHSFAKGGVTFHSYVSPAMVVNVTAHVVEFDDALMLVDSTFMPPTAAEVAGLISAAGKPVAQAITSHEHPDHWGGAPAFEGITFDTLPEIREGIRAESGGDFGTPTNVLDGGDIIPGMTEIAGVPVDFRHYRDNEAPHMLVAVLPEQQVAIVQDLVYNGVFFAPGVNRKNWIATLEELRDDPACETLLVGHGLPTSRGELDTAIAYVKAMDEVLATAANPEEASAQIKAAYPGYGGDFLLSLIAEYWDR
ncbi:Metallo-beta-lactamase [Candidatus Rhodobacter oscarellae]|uniref:Metallo-beta-lactamase n=1 Tax=Candidatus Rhodobacter oscarellae TaxID=1675527 RepID=A0A0J9E0M2_9RHOB|nr:Metallo-beta-lactamase [Candidatus Rhodobacter lobularis]